MAQKYASAPDLPGLKQLDGVPSLKPEGASGVPKLRWACDGRGKRVVDLHDNFRHS